ncbi:MAG: hypothetical protein ACLU18_17125 [Bacteroides thetaiotaomicron]
MAFARVKSAFNHTSTEHASPHGSILVTSWRSVAWPVEDYQSTRRMFSNGVGS